MEPPIPTSVAGVKTRTGNTAEPTPLEPMVSEVKVGAMTMGAAGSCWVPALLEVASRNTPAPCAAPRVKPDSVMVMAAVPVAAPAVVITIWVLVELTAAAEPVSEVILLALAAKVAVPMK